MPEIFLPKGYRFSGVHCGLKSDAALLDLSLIVSDRPAAAAGVFTPNLVCGAPVQVDRERLQKQSAHPTGIRAVVGNSRCANGCTGEQGLRDADEMAALAAQSVGGTAEQGLVMSTGVIGTMLPMDKVRKGIADAAAALTADETGFLNAARGIMTTDTVEKFVTKKIVFNELDTGGRMSAALAPLEVRIAGLCKGAAMMAPHLATMLAVVVTDAALEPATAQTLLKEIADVSFNCISIDGHVSTSDTLLLLANGAASDVPLTGEALNQFAAALKELCIELAMKIPADGEGASHLITIDVQECKTRSDAEKIARRIAEDALVKTAIFGADPNWGRIVSASGTAGVPYNPKNVSLKLNGFDLFRNGEPIPFDKAAVSSSIRSHRDTSFVLSIGEGNESLRFWTTDLTTEYVRLNSDYTT